MSYSTTKTPYRPANRQPVNRRHWWWLLVFVLLLIGGGLLKKIFSTPVISATIQARAAFNDTAQDIGSFGYWLTSNKKLIAENIELRKLADRTRALEAKVEILKQEKNDLLASIDRIPSKTKASPARILTAPDQSPYDTFLVDLGRDNGYINLGTSSLVTDLDGVLLGQLGDIGHDWSQIVLFSTPGQTLPVIVGTSTLRAVARGVGGGNFIIEIPHGAEVQPGTIVRSSSKESRPVGIVEVVTYDKATTFDRLLIRVPVNIFMLNQVLIYDAAS